MIHLDFPKQDGILLTKKGLMQISYFKELVVAKPLPKTEENNKQLKEFLQERLMTELVKDVAKFQKTISNSAKSMAQESSSAPPPTEHSTKPEGSSTWEMPPLLSQWTEIVLETLSKNPEKIGRKIGKLDLEMRPSLFMGNHPMIHRTVLHRMVRFLRSAYKDHKNEDILVMHREQKQHPPSCGDGARYILQPRDILLLLPTTLSQSAAHLRFELGTHFCRRCMTTETVNPAAEHKCSACGTTLELLHCMGTIHSHGSMSAFSSGTDNKYEIPHIGFHMTAGNLDATQESLVLSFCDGETRIPLNISDLFAIEKEDASFDGQITNWLIVRSKKKEEKKEWVKPIVAERREVCILDRAADRMYYRDYGEPFSAVDDAELTITRTENKESMSEENRVMLREAGMEAIDLGTDMIEIVAAIDDAQDGKRSWLSAAAVVRHFMWNLDDDEVEELHGIVEEIHKQLKPEDLDYKTVENLLGVIKTAAEYEKEWL
jgi:hypothetical protein